MLIKLISLTVLFLSGNNGYQSKDTVFVVNGNKSINIVSTEFLSFSIDLDSLLKGINNSSSNAFIESLTPAFVQVLDLDNQFSQFSSNISLPKWKLLQEWFKKFRLVPIFTINNANNQLWDPKNLLPFLDQNQELDNYGYWQLIYDCNYKSLIKYKEDLTMLKYVLDVHPPSKIVTGNLRSCRNADAKALANTVEDLDGVVDAYMLDSIYAKRDFIHDQTPTWIAMPKTNRSGFQSALQWAKQIGEAAKNLYDAVFYNGDFNAVFNDTPVFWMSFLYKKIMGNVVLDIRTNALIKYGVDITAYCAKQYPKQGAMAISIVNNANQEFTASIKLAGTQPNSVEIQKYILTSKNNDCVLLNGKKLTSDVLGSDPRPEVENVKVDDGILHLTVPAQSIGIFVLPGAKIPACGSTTNTNSAEDEEESMEITSRLDLTSQHKINFDELKNTLDDLNNGQKKGEVVGSPATSNDFRRMFGNKARSSKTNDKTTKLEIIFAERPLKDKLALNNARHIELQLTNEEIKKILLDRAKARVAEDNIKTNNKQLEFQMARAAKKLVKNNDTDKQKYKRFAANPKRRSKNLRRRSRRDINMDILKTKLSATNEKSQDLIADLAHEKNAEDYFEEEVLKSGERYLDDRVRFLKDPTGVDSALEDDVGQYHGYFENFKDDTNYRTDRIKRESGDHANADPKLPTEDVLGNIRRWQNRFTLPLPSLKRRFQSEIVSSRRNKKADVRLLKEKMENRKKMNGWIRARQKKNATRSKRSLLNHDAYTPKVRDVKSASHYVPKIFKNNWKPTDLRTLKKKPSYSFESLDKREFMQSLPILKRKQRKPRNSDVDVHLTDNTIDDRLFNTISKIKFQHEKRTDSVVSTTATTSTVVNDDQTTVGFNETEPTITLTEDIIANDKTFFNNIVDSVRDFVETVYGKISSYFMG